MDSSPPRSESSPTASPRARVSKYASEEEKKAAQRERKRLWAQKKRAEIKRLALEAKEAASNQVHASPASPASKAKHPVQVAPPVALPTFDDGLSVKEDSIAEAVKAEFARDQLDGGKFLEYDPTLIFPPSYPKTDTIIIPPPSTPHSQLLGRDIRPIDVMVLFLPGNPGLISYYDKYLHELATQLAWSDSNVRYDILGVSHAGFHVDPEGDPPNQLYSLRDQIALKVELLHALWKSRPGLKVVLVGHSIGAYMLMETLRAVRSQIRAENEGEVIGGVLLFPTITHLAQSPRGRWVTPIVTKFPGFTTLSHWYIRIITFLLPGILLDLFLRLILPGFTAESRKVTSSFLHSPVGVKESIHLSIDEMHEVKDDVWDDAQWGVTPSTRIKAQRKAPEQELVFYFAEKDPWVAPNERDELIRRRARGGREWTEDQYDDDGDSRPRMIICKEGIQHSFSIADSDTMASKTSTWIEEIVENHFSKLAK